MRALAHLELQRSPLLAQVSHSWSSSSDPRPVQDMTEPADPDPEPAAPPQQTSAESPGGGLKMDQEMKITDSIGDGGKLRIQQDWVCGEIAGLLMIHFWNEFNGPEV